MELGKILEDYGKIFEDYPEVSARSDLMKKNVKIRMIIMWEICRNMSKIDFSFFILRLQEKYVDMKEYVENMKEQVKNNMKE